jgi:hypothetical protein
MRSASLSLKMPPQRPAPRAEVAMRQAALTVLAPRQQATQLMSVRVRPRPLLPPPPARLQEIRMSLRLLILRPP